MGERPDMHAAVDIALETWDTTDGDERTRLLAMLNAFTVALRATGAIPSPKPAVPWSDVAGAARWLGETSGHPRYAGDAWESMLHNPYDQEFAAARVRARPGLAPETPTLLRAALAALDAHHKASAASAAPLTAQDDQPGVGGGV